MMMTNAVEFLTEYESAFRIRGRGYVINMRMEQADRDALPARFKAQSIEIAAVVLDVVGQEVHRYEGCFNGGVTEDGKRGIGVLVREEIPVDRFEVGEIVLVRGTTG